MVLISDDEARGFLFSYGKLMGTKEKTKTDHDNQAEGNDTSIDRTRRLCLRDVQPCRGEPHHRLLLRQSRPGAYSPPSAWRVRRRRD